MTHRVWSLARGASAPLIRQVLLLLLLLPTGEQSRLARDAQRSPRQREREREKKGLSCAGPGFFAAAQEENSVVARAAGE